MLGELVGAFGLGPEGARVEDPLYYPGARFLAIAGRAHRRDLLRPCLGLGCTGERAREERLELEASEG